MLQQGLMERSSSSWCINVVMVTKMNGMPHFYVDYRAVNNKPGKTRTLYH